MNVRVVAAVVAVVLVAGPFAGTTAPASGASPARPVLIVEGTGSNQSGADLTAKLGLSFLAQRLRADGYQPYVFSLPGGGIGDMRDTAAAVRVKVDQVLAETGAASLDIVGHSQGGLVSRYYVKYLGGAGRVGNLVSLATPHYGTRLANLALLFGLLDCLGFPFCQQAAVGSDFLADLNAGDDTIGNVRYTNIVSKLDEIVLPYTNAFLADDGNNTNVAVQDQCPLRIVEHFTIPGDGAVYGGIADALARRPVTLDCLAL